MRQGGQVEQPKQIRLSWKVSLFFSLFLWLYLFRYVFTSLSFSSENKDGCLWCCFVRQILVVLLHFAQAVAAFQHDPKVQICFNLVEFGPTFIKLKDFHVAALVLF